MISVNLPLFALSVNNDGNDLVALDGVSNSYNNEQSGILIVCFESL